VARRIPHWLSATLTSAALVSAVTGLIALLEPAVPAVGLGLLYLAAVAPIALLYGGTAAAVVSVATMTVFSFFFLAPRYSLNAGSTEHWGVLVAFLVSSLVVGQLAARAQREVRRSRQLAAEQAALRRVATLVAQGTRPERVFDAIVEEVGRLFSVDLATMGRYEPDDALTFVAAWERARELFPVGSRRPLGEHNLGTRVFETSRSARVDHIPDSTSGETGDTSPEAAINSSIASPIMIEGRLWGLIAVASSLKRPLPPDTEARLEGFTELAATAVANAESRSELTASRARIVTAFDDARRRLERDLHDGTQQRLVSLALDVRGAEQQVPAESAELRADLARVAEGLAAVLDDLREISRGIHPAILAEGGLGPALRALARRSPVKVEAEIKVDTRLPVPIEIAAYYVVSESLANAAKHARATLVHVEAEKHDGKLRVSIRDDGVGGADPARGTGLIGLRDRMEALGGSVEISSRLGEGTQVVAELAL
jgi:signal transduction histidine kinase